MFPVKPRHALLHLGVADGCASASLTWSTEVQRSWEGQRDASKHTVLLIVLQHAMSVCAFQQCVTKYLFIIFRWRGTFHIGTVQLEKNVAGLWCSELNISLGNWAISLSSAVRDNSGAVRYVHMLRSR